MNRTPPAPPSDRLEAIRDAVRMRRDLANQLIDAESRTKELKAQINFLEHETLPDLFAEAGMRGYILQKEGNQPAYSATAKPYYHAVIASSWPQERKAAAFNWLIENDGGDLIKQTVTIEFDRGTNIKPITEFLNKQRVDYRVDLTVAWKTLTSFIKELIEVKKMLPPLDLLGATVGRIVEVKERKDD